MLLKNDYHYPQYIIGQLDLQTDSKQCYTVDMYHEELSKKEILKEKKRIERVLKGKLYLEYGIPYDRLMIKLFSKKGKYHKPYYLENK